MSNKKTLSTEAIEQMIHKYKQGTQINTIASEHNVSRTTVIVALKQHNVYQGKYVKTKTRVIIHGEKSKYDDLFFEPIAEGMNYEEYLNKYKLKRNKYA